MILLHTLWDHIKVINLILANHAEVFPNDFNKGAKWECINWNKITPLGEFQQTIFFLQTNGTGVCCIIWAPHPNFVLPKFTQKFLEGIWPSTLQTWIIYVPMLAKKMDQVHHPVHLHPPHHPCIPATLPLDHIDKIMPMPLSMSWHMSLKWAMILCALLYPSPFLLTMSNQPASPHWSWQCPS